MYRLITVFQLFKRLTRDFVGDSHNENLVVKVFRTQPEA